MYLTVTASVLGREARRIRTEENIASHRFWKQKGGICETSGHLKGQVQELFKRFTDRTIWIRDREENTEIIIMWLEKSNRQRKLARILEPTLYFPRKKRL